MKLEKITLTRAEGVGSDIGIPHMFSSFSEANHQLRSWASTAPEQGYDKVDFRVDYEAYSYVGRYDMKKNLEGNHTLEETILNYCRYLRESEIPSIKEEYETYKNTIEFFYREMKTLIEPIL